MAKKVDINKYLYNNRITGQSLIDMANRDRIDPMDSYASIFAANTGSNVDDSVMRAMSDYYTKNPIGEKTRANVEQYGIGERDFLNRLDNFKKNYTASIGPALQDRINAYARGMEPTSLQNEPMPTSSTAAPTTPMKIERVGQAGSVLSRKEAESIAKARDTDVESILSRSIGRGLAIGGNLASRFAAGKYDSPERARQINLSSMLGDSELGAMRAASLGGKPGKPGTDSIRNYIGTQGAISKGSALYVDPRAGVTSMLPRGLAGSMTLPTRTPKPQKEAGPGPSALPGGGGGVNASAGAMAAGMNPQFNPQLGGTPSPVSPTASPNPMPSNIGAIRTASGTTSFRGNTKLKGKKAGLGTTIAK